MSRSRTAAEIGEPRDEPTGHRLAWCLCLGLSAGAGHACAQPAGQPAATSDENAQARRWFEDAKFGLFIHWGVYSLAGQGRVGDGPRQAADLPSTPSSPRASIRRGSTPSPGSSWPSRPERNTSRSPPSTTTASACSPAG